MIPPAWMMAGHGYVFDVVHKAWACIRCDAPRCHHDTERELAEA